MAAFFSPLMFSIEWIPLILATVVSMGFGALWYSPAGMGKPWMRSRNLSTTEVNDPNFNMIRALGMTALYTLIIGLATQFIVSNMVTYTLPQVIMVTTLIWAAYSLCSQLTSREWLGYPYTAALIEQGNILFIILANAILMRVM